MRGIVVLGLISLILLPGCTSRTDSSWHIQTVDGVDTVSGYTSLAIDRDNYPHISCINKGQLEYVVWSGSVWDIQVVDSGHGDYTTSLVLDGSGYPHISYNQWAGDGLKYAAWNGSSWDIQTVDREGYVGEDNSLALDGDGYPHISYAGTDITDVYRPDVYLKYASWNGLSWDIETVDSMANVTAGTSLVLDNSDCAHISYNDETNGVLKYAAWNGSSWDIQAVDSIVEYGGHSSLVLDNRGRPHISYQGWGEGGDSRLKYAVWNASSWDIQTVDSTDHNVGDYSSLTLDSSGHAHISYWGKRLKYAAWDGSSWDIQVVDNARQMSWFTFPAQDMVPINTSLALDSRGFAHISCGGDYNLKYATNAPQPSSANGE